MHYNPQIVTSDSSAGAALHRRLSAVCEVLCARDVLALDIDPRDCEGTLENRGGEVRVKYYGTVHTSSFFAAFENSRLAPSHTCGCTEYGVKPYG